MARNTSGLLRWIIPMANSACGLAAMALILPVVLASPARAQLLYKVTVFQLPAGDTYGSGMSINDSGQVAVQGTDSANHNHAFLYTGGVLNDLGTLTGATDSTPNGINNSAYVVGSSGQGGFGNNAPFVYNAGGGMQPLGLASGADGGVATSINDSGQVAGYTTITDSVGRPVLYNPSSYGTPTDLGSLAGTPTAVGYATAINNAGHVVGQSTTASGDSHAFLYKNGVMSDLGTLGGASSAANAINNSDQITGSADTLTGTDAFLYTGGVMHDLGTLPGGTTTLPGSNVTTYGNAIDPYGWVVGEAVDDENSLSAFIYEGSGALVDLNTMISPKDPLYGLITLQNAQGINDVGQIVGYGLDTDSNQIGFILTPAPEPGSLCLLGIGLFGLLASRRCRVS